MLSRPHCVGVSQKACGRGMLGRWAGLRSHFQWINNRVIKRNDTERQTKGGTDWRTTRPDTMSVCLCVCVSHAAHYLCVCVCMCVVGCCGGLGQGVSVCVLIQSVCSSMCVCAKKTIWVHLYLQLFDPLWGCVCVLLFHCWWLLLVNVCVWLVKEKH